MTEQEQFVARHIEMLLARDLDHVMEDYLPDVVVRSAGHEYRGLDAVRLHLAAALAAAPDESRLDYVLDTRDDGQVVLTWRLFTAGSAAPVMHGHDVFRLHEGRIAEQVIAIAG